MTSACLSPKGERAEGRQAGGERREAALQQGQVLRQADGRQVVVAVRNEVAEMQADEGVDELGVGLVVARGRVVRGLGGFPDVAVVVGFGGGGVELFVVGRGGGILVEGDLEDVVAVIVVQDDGGVEGLAVGGGEHLEDGQRVRIGEGVHSVLKQNEYVG